MNSNNIGSTDHVSGNRLGWLPTYLIVFLAWWALAMLVLTFRMELPVWHFVVELFWWQALLFEKLWGPLPGVVWRLLWLAVYTGLGLACWWIVETRTPRKKGRAWRRAALSSLAAQFVLLAIAMVLAPE